MATTIQLAYSFAVIFTFPLQNYPSLEIVRRSVDRFQGETAVQSQQQDSIISAMIVVLLSIIAVSKYCVLFSHIIESIQSQKVHCLHYSHNECSG